jgi:hypothetical protein
MVNLYAKSSLAGLQLASGLIFLLQLAAAAPAAESTFKYAHGCQAVTVCD